MFIFFNISTYNFRISILIFLRAGQAEAAICTCFVQLELREHDSKAGRIPLPVAVFLRLPSHLRESLIPNLKPFLKRSGHFFESSVGINNII
ncbi:hypothetical protein L484_018258 [Morus notabilis]|uniref:Secreted protein n=1 Tax=Morus notabilis TaxID=981085 RepID=W9S2M3_9ROSA|nr:hypothetical protein L484_018258 [Morus notabilis]